MKNKNYRDSRKKHETLEKLNRKKAEGVKFVVWTIPDDKVLKKIQENFEVTEHDIIIKTKRFYDNKSLNNSLLRGINYSAIRNIHSIVMPFKSKTINTLKMNHVDFKIRYKFFLS